MRCFFICGWWFAMCEAGRERPTGPRFGGRPGLELQNSRESLLPTMVWCVKILIYDNSMFLSSRDPRRSEAVESSWFICKKWHTRASNHFPHDKDWNHQQQQFDDFYGRKTQNAQKNHPSPTSENKMSNNFCDDRRREKPESEFEIKSNKKYWILQNLFLLIFYSNEQWIWVLLLLVFFIIFLSVCVLSRKIWCGSQSWIEANAFLNFQYLGEPCLRHVTR